MPGRVYRAVPVLRRFLPAGALCAAGFLGCDGAAGKAVLLKRQPASMAVTGKAIFFIFTEIYFLLI